MQGIPLPRFGRYATGTESPWLSSKDEAYQAAYRAARDVDPSALSDNNARRAGENASREAGITARRAAAAARQAQQQAVASRKPYDADLLADLAAKGPPDGPNAITPTPTAPTPPMPGTPTPTAPATPTGPQVIVYGEDVWKNNPTTQFLNGQLGYDQFNTLSSLSTTDPATGSYIQAPRSMNAATMMAIARDPVRLGMIKAQMTRMNRDWDKEFADALAAGPSGNAHGYFRTG